LVEKTDYDDDPAEGNPERDAGEEIELHAVKNLSLAQLSVSREADDINPAKRCQ
jgi:hypothetical protein